MYARARRGPRKAPAGLLAALLSAPVHAAPGDVLFADDFESGLGAWTVNASGGDASIGSETASSPTSSLRLRWDDVEVTSTTIAAGVPAATLSIWVRRGADSFSENPDNDNENLELAYLDDGGAWVLLESFSGADTPGEIFDRSYALPAAARHDGLRLRLTHTGGGGVDLDYWHVDDVRVVEGSVSGGFGAGSCEDFESGLGGWTIAAGSGEAGVDAATANSPLNSLFTRGGSVSVTSPAADLAGAFLVELRMWIRRGADSFSEDPDNNEDLVVEFEDAGGAWIALETFDGNGSPGEIFDRSYALPAAALHGAMRVRVRQTGGNSGFDYWHVDDVCLASGTLAAWSFEEAAWTGAAGEVADSGGAGLDGTAMGGASNPAADPAIPGNPGTCRYADLDGVDDFIEVPDAPELDISTSLTASAWINVRSLPSELATIVSKDWNYEFHVNASGQIYWWWNDAGGTTRNITTGTALSTDRWYHVAVVYTSGAQTIYLDGAPAASASFSGALRLNDLPLFIGVDWNFISRAFDGYIDEVRVIPAALSQTQVQSLMMETQPCDLGGAQFVINHDNYGIHCLPETITVQVVDATAGTPRFDYNAGVVLDTGSGAGSWSLVSGSGAFADATAGDGIASYGWPLGESEAVFSLTYPEGPPVINVGVVQATDPGISDNDAEGTLSFSPSGFTLTAAPLSNPPPAVIAPFDTPLVAATSFPVYISAYGQTPDDPVCGVIESYAGSRDLSFWFDYEDPASGTRLLAVDGNPVSAAEAGASAQTVAFTGGQAAVSGFYKDVGRLQIHVRDDGIANPDLPAGLRGATAGFVSLPARFAVTDVADAGGVVPNPAAADASGPVFLAAGEPFRVTVTALDAEGDPAPNYGREGVAESVRLEAALVAPAGGANPPVSAATGFGAFAGGAATGVDFVWPEVGILSVLPRVADGDYLGAGDVAGDVSANIGRFVPARFDVALNVPLFETACVAGGFTYVGETFDYLVAPVITATARAATGTTTLNYRDDFFRLSTATLANRAYASAAGGLDLGGLPAPAADPLVVDAGGGTGTLTFSAGTGIGYARGAPQAPFAADIELSIDVLDADGVAAANPVVFGSGGGIAFSAGDEMRYGRARLANALGSERVDLGVPMFTEYFLAPASGFVRNTGDSCTAGVTLAFSGFTDALGPGETCVLDAGAPGASGAGCSGAAPPALRFETPPAAGDFNLSLAAPGDGNQGSVLVSGAVPDWLKFDWDGATPGDEDPSGRVTFGIYSGSARSIYLREVF